MTEALAEVKQSLLGAGADCYQFDCEPIGADAWVISSLLQKSIRRGETEIAQRAALTFLNLKEPFFGHPGPRHPLAPRFSLRARSRLR